MSEPEPISYFNGEFIPASQAAMPLYDTGFVQGVTVTEQLRTFRGQLYRLEQHLERLSRSMKIVGIDLGMSLEELNGITRDVALQNHALLESGDDLGLAILVTPGPYGGLAPRHVSTGPTLCVHTYPVAFHTFANKFETGQSLAITSVRQVPNDCWPPELKCRSRMHYYLADREAKKIDPAARALMLDQFDHVTEASTANLVAYFADEGLVSPPKEKILPGISVNVLTDLAEKLGYRFSYRILTPADIARADEVFLTSTSPCMVPCVRLDNRPIGQGTPGEVFGKLIRAWSELVGVDIISQAKKFASR